MTNVLHSLRTLAAKRDFAPIAPTHARVPYTDAVGRSMHATAPLADVYLPDGEGAFPGVLLVHGGGFIIGSRVMKAMQLLAKSIRAAGFAVATIDYRKIGRGGRLDEGIEDVVAAVRWWTTAGPAEYGVRPGRISMLGVSAGATLCLLAAEELGEDVVGDIVSVFGLYDFNGPAGPLGLGLRRLVVRSGKPEDWTARSPVERTANIPLTMLHGTHDELVPVEQAHRLHAGRIAAGLPTTLHLYEGARHAFFNFEQIDPSPEAMGHVIEALRAAARGRE